MSGWIKFQPPRGTLLAGFGLLHGLLNASQNQLASRAALPCGGLAEAPVEVARDIDTRAHEPGLHVAILFELLK